MGIAVDRRRLSSSFNFFFDDLYWVEEVQQAFKMICMDKMLSDGYFDMSIYIYGRIKKDEMYCKTCCAQVKIRCIVPGSIS